MDKILEQLWNGEINPAAMEFKRNSEYHKLLQLICRNEEKLLETLNDGEKETFEKYKDCYSEMRWMENRENFITGFRLGVRMMMASITNNSGYGRAWKRIRDLYIAAHPLCEECQKHGVITSAQEVHHIKPLSQGGTHARSNLMALCTPCHSRITVEMGDRWHDR